MEARAIAIRLEGVDVGRLVRTLSLPTFALALALSVLTTYAPVLLGKTTASSTAIGIVVGGEGAFALFLPVAIGALSDRTRSRRLGARLPYTIVAAPLLVLPLVVLPFSGSYAGAAGLIALFYVGYFVYYPPYQALFAELVPAGHQGRALGAQGVMRGLGLGGALLVGGALLSLWAPLPFLLAAAAIVLATSVLIRDTRAPAARTTSLRVADAPALGLRRLLRENGRLRAFVIANALWELSFMGLKTFIVLYIVRGLGQPVATASAVIGVVAGAYVIAAWGAGRLADRLGLFRVLRTALWIYGAGLLVGAAASSLAPLLVGLPVVALAGAVLMTLPYGLLVRIMPPGAEGTASGLLGFSRGLGAILGPVVVGASIDLLGPLFPGTNGFGAMWIAIGVPIVLSLGFLPALGREDEPASEPLSVPQPATDAELALAA